MNPKVKDKNYEKKPLSEENRQNLIHFFGTDDLNAARKIINKNDSALKKLEKMIKDLEEE